MIGQTLSCGLCRETFYTDDSNISRQCVLRPVIAATWYCLYCSSFFLPLSFAFTSSRAQTQYLRIFCCLCTFFALNVLVALSGRLPAVFLTMFTILKSMHRILCLR